MACHAVAAARYMVGTFEILSFAWFSGLFLPFAYFLNSRQYLLSLLSEGQDGLIGGSMMTPLKPWKTCFLHRCRETNWRLRSSINRLLHNQRSEL